MGWKSWNFRILWNVFLTISLGLPGSEESCPNACACKWKSGKQTVECLEKALMTLPENIDRETQVLDVSGNNLQTVPKEAFHRMNLTNLQRVHMKRCRIGRIGNRAFRGLTNLVELDISHNLLTAVPSASFEDTPFLRYLSLANNPIQKVESDAFKMVMGLVKIDLSQCEIQRISPHAFEYLESLEWMKLNGNKLIRLHPETVETMRKLHGIELHDNPWVCDCRLRSMKNWISHDETVKCPVPLRCASPERVSGRFFDELDLDDFACKPQILPSGRYVEAAAGENATIMCRVGAEPPANVHWYWNGRLLLNNSAFSAFQKIFIEEVGMSEKNSSLTLVNAANSDSGEFFCVAENKAGTVETNITLNVIWRRPKQSFLKERHVATLGGAAFIIILIIMSAAGFLLLRSRRSAYLGNKTSDEHDIAAIPTTIGGAPKTKKKAGKKDRNEGKFEDPGSLVRDSSGKKSASQAARSLELLYPESTSLDPDVVPGAEKQGMPTNLFRAAAGNHHSGTIFFSRDRQYSAHPVFLWNHLAESTPSCASARTQAPEEKLSRPDVKEYPPDYGLPMPKTNFAEPKFLMEKKNLELHDASDPQEWNSGFSIFLPARQSVREITTSPSLANFGGDHRISDGTDV